MPRFDCKIAQALNKLIKKTLGNSHHIVNLRPSSKFPFDEYIERVKDVVDAGDFFYIKRYGKFDAMPACWKHLDEQQIRNVAALVGLFYDESKADCSKEPWELPNIKRLLNLGNAKLDNLAKINADYLETQGNDSVFFVTHFIDSSDDDIPKVEDDSIILDENDDFALNPKKLINEFQQKPGNPRAQGNIFCH